MPLGKTIADGYVEIRLDDSKLDADTKAKVTKVTNTFGSRLNKELQALDIEPIDVQADPRSALREIERTQEKLRELADNAATVELKVKAERASAQLSQFRKQIGEVTSDAGPEAAVGFAAKFSGKLAPLMEKVSLAAPLGIAVGAAGAAAAPLLAAALSGAIIGGAGIGGVVGGITLAAKDGRVKEAAKGLADDLGDRMEDAAGTFVQPTLAGIERIDQAFDTIDFTRIFASSSRYVDELADSAGNSLTSFGDALETLIANAGPVVTVIGQGIETIVDSLSDGLVSISDDGETAAVALETVFNLIGQGITTTLQLVNVLTELYGISKAIGADLGLQLILKATGTEMEKTGDSARKTGAGTFAMAGDMEIAANAADKLAAATKELKPQQDLLAAAQKTLSSTLDQLSSKNSNAALTANSLRTAYQNLFGATQNQTEANEAYQASFDALSETVKANAKEVRNNKDNLDIHSKAGRSNRDVLQDLLTKNNELYFADIAAGKSVAYATGEHRKRTEQVVKEAEKVKLNKSETDKLIGTYGRIPGKKATDLVLDGVKGIIEELKKLYTMQRALALGININLVTGTGTVKNFKATGGPITGPGTGTSDDVPIWGSHGEHMWTAAEVRAAGGHRAVYAMRKEILANAKGYATGGAILTAVDTSTRWPFRTNLDNTKVMSAAEARSKVIPFFSSEGWPSSPSAVRGDSGRWRKIRTYLENAHLGGDFGNGYRPGDPKWHGSGWAVDWMGFNQDALATRLAALKPLELIHRTNKRDYAYTRGRNKGSFNNALMQAHRNHIHIAMRDGGEVPRLIPFGSYDSGGTLPTGLSLAFNGTGRPEPVGHGLNGEVHIHIHDSVIASESQAVDLVARAYKRAKYERKIP